MHNGRCGVCTTCVACIQCMHLRMCAYVYMCASEGVGLCVLAALYMYVYTVCDVFLKMCKSKVNKERDSVE